MFISVLGRLGAPVTAAANVPQVIKCVRTGKADDLSSKVLITLSLGLILWLAYGPLRGDPIIVAANGVSLCLVAVLLRFKWHGIKCAVQP